MSQMPVAPAGIANDDFSSSATSSLREPTSFAVFADELTEPLLRQARALVRDADLAQDLVQQTLIRAWERAAELPAHPAARRAWCSQTLLNFARMGLRSHKARENREKDVASRRAQRVEMEAQDPVRELIAEEAWTLAMELEEPIREVLALRFGMGMTLRETAEALGVPEGTVATRQRSGLEQLRRRLGLKPHAAATLAGGLGLLMSAMSEVARAEPAAVAECKAALAASLPHTCSGSATSATCATGGASTATAAGAAGATASAAGLASMVALPVLLLAGATAFLLFGHPSTGSTTNPAPTPSELGTPAGEAEPTRTTEPQRATPDPPSPSSEEEEALIRFDESPCEQLETTVPVHHPCHENGAGECEAEQPKPQEKECEPSPGEVCPEELANMLRAEPVRLPLHSSAWSPHY